MNESMQDETLPPAPKPRRQARRGRTVSTKPEDIERRKRDLRCVELRQAGVKWQPIADQLGYASPGHAYDGFMRVLKDYPREDVETWRNTISDRYDTMLRALWPEVIKGRWLAIDRATRICEMLAKLHGANRPEKFEVTPGETDLDTALRELETQMRRRAAGRPVPQE